MTQKREKVFYSRDVKFNESEKQKEEQASTDPDVTYRMALDISENTEAPCDETETLVQEQSAMVPSRSE